MKLLVLGANGQLGSDFIHYADQLGYETVGLTHEDVEVTNREQLFEVLSRMGFDAIINTTAYQGPKAYRDSSPAASYDVNAYAPYHLAEFAAENNKVLVHIGTDFVFSGCTPPEAHAFTEQDLPQPANLYAASKLAGEALIPLATESYFVFRLASLYGATGSRAKGHSNFVKMVVNKLSNKEPVRIVDDIRSSPTSAKSVVFKIAEVIETEKYGLYHLAGSGSCTWYEFAVEIASQLELPVDLIERSSTREVTQEVKRGNNTSLRNQRLIDEGFEDLAPWQENLREYLRERRM